MFKKIKSTARVLGKAANSGIKDIKQEGFLNSYSQDAGHSLDEWKNWAKDTIKDGNTYDLYLFEDNRHDYGSILKKVAKRTITFTDQTKVLRLVNNREKFAYFFMNLKDNGCGGKEYLYYFSHVKALRVSHDNVQESYDEYGNDSTLEYLERIKKEMDYFKRIAELSYYFGVFDNDLDGYVLNDYSEWSRFDDF